MAVFDVDVAAAAAGEGAGTVARWREGGGVFVQADYNGLVFIYGESVSYLRCMCVRLCV